MIALALTSMYLGAPEQRAKNSFGFGPIVEVAILFAGIFITMVPALALLEQHGRALGLDAPWQFFLASGALSSVLDNAPTYVTFLAAAQSLHLPAEVVGVPHLYLVAISLGSVLMGANTYIGNGPNFMVKAIAEQRGVRMPSFFGYLGWSCLVLLPTLYLVSRLFVASP
jgi:Na+/H+ antiporter NhaD/arsenite permease-like protein